MHFFLGALRDNTEVFLSFQACSFLLSNAEQLDYGELYKSCITLLLAGTAVDRVKPKLSLLVRYNKIMLGDYLTAFWLSSKVSTRDPITKTL